MAFWHRDDTKKSRKCRARASKKDHVWETYPSGEVTGNQVG